MKKLVSGFIDVCSAQAFTAAYVSAGDPIYVPGYQTLTLFVDITSNNTTDATVKVVTTATEGATTEYDMPIKTTSATKTELGASVYEFTSDSSPKMIVPIDISGCSWCQVKIKGTGNAPAAGTATIKAFLMA